MMLQKLRLQTNRKWTWPNEDKQDHSRQGKKIFCIVRCCQRLSNKITSWLQKKYRKTRWAIWLVKFADV